MFYLIGTGKAIKDAVKENHLEAELTERTKVFKNRTYPWLMAAMALAIATFVLGGGYVAGALPNWLHVVLVLRHAGGAGMVAGARRTGAAAERSADERDQRTVGLAPVVALVTISTPTTRPSKLPDTWRISLPVFEGPLDLLLELIKVNQVEITDIPVALICDQFHEYLALMEELDLDVAGEYIYEAALLIQLKSRMLLPRTGRGAGRRERPAPGPGAPAARVPADERGRADAGRDRPHAPRDVGARRRPRRLLAGDEVELDLEEVSLFDLLKVFREALDRYGREHPEPLIYRGESYPVRGQFERLLAARAGRDSRSTCSTTCSRSPAAPRRSSAFLAVLELARLHLVRIHQSSSGAILLYRTTRELAPEDLEAIQR